MDKVGAVLATKSTIKGLHSADYIGVARVQWVHLHPPRAEKKFCIRNSQGKFVSAPPTHQVHSPGGERVNVRTVFAVLGRFGA